MRHILLTPLLLVALVGFVGCHKPAVRDKPLPDPLLTSKNYIKGRSVVPELGDPREELPLPPPPPAPIAPERVPGSVVHMLGQPTGR